MVGLNSKNYSNGSASELENDKDEYDPHKNRQLEHPNTSVETLLHVVKGCLGTGILAMPEAYKYAGMISAIVSTFLIGLFNAYCFHILISSQYVLCKRRRVAVLTYPDSMKAAVADGPMFLRRLKPYASHITNALIISYQIGSSAVYILFMAENIKLVLNTYINNQISLTNYILLCFVPVYLISCVKNLKLLAIVSLLGNVLSILTYIVIGYYASQNLRQFNDLTMVGKPMDYPLFFGTALYSLQSIGVITSAENNMSNPKNFRKPFGVLNISMSLLVVVYVFVAGVGYWSYGEDIKSSITLNFPTDQPLGQSIRVLYSLAIYISYSLNMYVVFEIFWRELFEQKFKNSSNLKRSLADYLHRLAWVFLTFVLAISVPFLGLVTSFLGNFNISLLMFMFPAIMEICVSWPNDLGWNKWILWKNCVIIIFGALSFSAGTYSTIHAISRSYAKITK